MRRFLDQSSLWSRGVIALVVIRLIMVVLLFADVPKLDYHVGWAFYHGGDEFTYFKVAQDILRGQLNFTTVSGAWAFVVALAVWLTGATHFEESLSVLVMINGVVLGVCSVWVMAELTRLLTGSERQSFFAAAVWTLMPYTMWIAFAFFPKAIALQNVYVPRQLWMNGLTDGPSIFLVMLGAVLLLRAHQSNPTKILLWVAAGASLGLAMAIRIHTLAMVAPILLALALVRAWRGAMLTVVGNVIGFSPQMIYNGLVGNILDTPYIRNWLRPEGGFHFEWNNTPFSPRFLINNVIAITRGNIVLMATGVAAVAAVVYGFFSAWRRRGGAEAIIMFIAPLASFGLHVTTYLFLDDGIRFSMPTITLGLPAMTWTLFEVGSLLRNYFQKGSQA